jgi:DNA-binding Lrp family transcriptional regulator
MTAVERLVDVATTLSQLKDRLRASEPELVEEIEELEKEKGKLVDQAKAELREMGPGSHTIKDMKFTVTLGGTKKVYNSDDVMELAEELGHSEILRQYRVLKTEVDSTQIERLPADIKSHYVELCEVQQQTARVSLPKTLT